MGPQASLYAHRRLLDYSAQVGALDNNDYPRITHLSVNVPDFISNNRKKPEALRLLISAVSDINTDSVDSGFIACNTAHVLYEDLSRVVGGEKLVSLVDETNTYLDELGPTKKIALLATPSTVRAKLYPADILPTHEQQEHVEECIRALISNADPRDVADTLSPVLDDFAARGATHVLLGCTELSMTHGYISFPAIVDPLDIITEKMLAKE